MADPVALITGATGQDGAYLADLLLNKGYIVHGIKRRSSSFNTARVDHLYRDPHGSGVRFFLHYGDMTDSTNLIRIMQEVQPTEIYNLAAQSHVRVSFETPEYTANADALGTLRLLEAIRILRLEEKVRFYQASTSELYGMAQEMPQRETTPFYPRSPYAAAKLYAYWITVNYREAYRMHASNGILFNHEGPTRGETFVTRKITRAVAAIELGLQEKLYLGNLSPSAIGVTRAIMSRACGLSFSSRSPTTMYWPPARSIQSANLSRKLLLVSTGTSNGADLESPSRASISAMAAYSLKSIHAISDRRKLTRCWVTPAKQDKNLGGTTKLNLPIWCGRWSSSI